MATYIQGLYDNPLPITPFTPDYTFLQSVLRYKEGEYEQGFAQVKNLYNSLLSSKASNAENTEVQKAYIADAERKLQNLASVDLSVPQNVGLAKSVFKTFLNDDELMHDINVTRISDTQLAKGQSFLQSDDPKQRAMHSALADEYVSTVPINELKWAKRGDGSITRVRPRYYIPAVNLTEKFKDFLDVSKYKSFTETANGAGYIFRTVGGENVEKGIFNLMNGLLTGDERKYFDMWGEVLYNRGIDDYVTNRGLSVDEAKRELANDFYERDLNYKKDFLESNKNDLAIINDKIDIYMKKGNLSQAEASELLSLGLTRTEYNGAIKKLEGEIDELLNPNKRQEVFDKYYNGKWGILSEQILTTSMKSISQGMGLLTRGNEIKANDAFFKMMEIEINKFNAETARIKALGGGDEDGGGAGGGTGGGGGKGRKLTEAEQKLAVTNTPSSTGYETVPQAKEKLETWFQNYAKTYDIIFKNGTEVIENILRSKFNESGSQASIGTLLSEMLKKKSDNTLNTPVTELDPNAKSTNSVLKVAVDRFLNLYGKGADGSPASSEWSKYLETRTDKNAPPTWSDMYDFLFQKAKVQYNAEKSAYSPEQRFTLDAPFERINRANNLLDLFKEDEKEVNSFILDKLPSLVDGKTYNLDILTVTDPNGFKRLATKEEIREKYNEANEVIGYQIWDTNNNRPLTDRVYTTVPYLNPKYDYLTVMPVFKNENTAERKKVSATFNAYDKINGVIEKLVGDTLGANQFTLDDKTLSTFGTYSLGFRNDVTGEIGEQAITRLFSDDLIGSVSKPENDKTQVVDVKAIAGDDPSTKEIEKLRELLGELKSNALTPQTGWNGTITYKQFTGDRGDNRKEYIVRFDGSQLDQMYKKYITSGDGYDADKAKMVAKIRDNGIQLRTDIDIPGGIEKFGIIERYYQSMGYYESDKELDGDMFYYRIDKKADGSGYYLSDDSYYYTLDPITGSKIKNNLSGIDFPPGSSFTYGRDIINQYIQDRIVRSQRALDQNKNNPGTKKITATDVLRSIGQ